MSNTKSLKISVIMPVYNAQKYVAEAVESILNQTFKNFEFIIINDGSTDKSLQIIKKYALKDKRIKIISRANTGYIIALNEGLKIAEGKYIARMDADDISLPERFEKQLTYLEKHPEYVALGSRVMLIDPKGAHIIPFCLKQTHEEIDADHLQGKGGTINHPSSMIRKKAITKLGGYRCRFKPAEDYDLFLRLAEIGKLANLPEILLKYRVHLESVSHLNPKQQQEISKIALKEAYTRRRLVKKNKLIKIEDPPRIVDLYRRWAWFALKGKNINTARKYTLKAFLRNPFSKKTWILLYCIIRGY